MSNFNGADISVNSSTKDQNNLFLKIDRLYVKEVSCKIPHAPGVFESAEFKEVIGQIIPSIEVNTKAQPIAENKYEVVLHAIVQGKAKNISLFVLDIQQAGIFILNVPAKQLKQTIEENCAGYLHVYLSQAISNTIMQSGFPPIVLQPLQPIVNTAPVLEKLPLQKTTEPVKNIQGISDKSTLKPN